MASKTLSCWSFSRFATAAAASSLALATLASVSARSLWRVAMTVSVPATRAATLSTATRARNRRTGSAFRPLLALAPGLLLGTLPVTLVDARLDVLALGPADREIGRCGPRRDLLQLCAPEQEAGVAIGTAPLPGRANQAPVLTQVLARIVDPRAEPCPRGEQGLVGDLDRRLPGRRLPIERQQPVASVGVQRRLDELGFDVERIELAPRDATPRVLPSFADRDEPQEHLSDRPLPVRLGGREDAIGPRRQGSRHAADLLECREGEPVAVPSLEQLRERVLEQRKRAGLVGDVGDDLGLEAGLDGDADPFDRPSDRLLDLVGRERRHRLGPCREQLAEPRVRQRAVVEVGAKRHDDSDPALGIECRHAQGLEEQLPLVLVTR